MQKFNYVRTGNGVSFYLNKARSIELPKAFAVQRLLSNPHFFWALLALPSLPMMVLFLKDPASAGHLLHSSGEFAARFMIIALMVTPLRLLFPKSKWLVWLMRRRRYVGVAAFGYALLHTVFYIVDMGAVRPMLDEFWALGIWTGWLAFVIFVPLALTSNDVSQRWLLSKWKPLQRWVYLAAILTLIHWIFVHNNLGPALVHFVPLALLETYRIVKNLRQSKTLNLRSFG